MSAPICIPGTEGPTLFATPADVLAYVERVNGWILGVDTEWAREDFAQRVESDRGKWAEWRGSWELFYWRVRGSVWERIGSEYDAAEAFHVELIAWRKKWQGMGAEFRGIAPTCPSRGGFHPLDDLADTAGRAVDGAVSAGPSLLLLGAGALGLVGIGLVLSRGARAKGAT